ncbi:MAG: hypothetical protein OJF47_003121 [Nitrospira sp.]|jgi:mono/diheme cytochrome c family protein|nr:MAG: hypothetical protein OJF47_003121 [Nitrospira sp.]
MATAAKKPEPPDERSLVFHRPLTRAARRITRLSDGLFLGLLSVCSGAGLLLAQPSEPLDRGQAIYLEHCMDCHGAAGKGDGVKAPFLSPRPGNLVSAATSAKTDKELLRTIAQGKPHTAMSAWQDRLSNEDQQAVLRYIRSLIRFTRPATPSPPTP